jgi:hypothetical protein
MKMTGGSRWLALVVLLAAFACAGNWGAAQVRSMRDRSEVTTMTAAKKTVCIGRYLVDVPAQSEVSFSGALLDSFAIDTTEESDAAFRDRIAAREAEISARGSAMDGSGGMVEARDLHIPGIVGRTFIFGRNRGYWFEEGRRVDNEWVAVEIHAHTEGHSLKDEVPAAPGFCIRRDKSEHMVMHLGLPGHPDLGLALASLAGGAPGTSLPARVAEAEARTSADLLLRMNKLRKGKRLINGIEGEEVLVRAREFNLATTYGFSWHASGAQDDLLQPYLSPELRTGISARPGGKPVDTSLHEDALLRLWDSIAASIRLRKPETTAPSDPRPNSPIQAARPLVAH